ncbi:MAG: hypothetical protein MI757_19555 [Pirellulales bacterium]|nr:hypothetical protein [Pirellulales bacterium]
MSQMPPNNHVRHPVEADALLDHIRASTLSTVSPPLEITAQPSGISLDLAPSSTIEFVHLDEHIQPDDANSLATPIRHDASAAGGPWVETTRQLTRVVDPQGGTYLEGERHACWFQPDSGKYVPIAGVHLHLGVADEDIAPSASGTVSVWNIASETPSDTTLNVIAFDWLGNGIAAGAAAYLIQHPQSRRWYAIAHHTSVSQFSMTTNQVVTAPTSGSDRQRVKFDTELESQGGANVNGRVALTTSGSDQGVMAPTAGHYLVSAAGALSVTRAQTSTINNATNASPIVITTSNTHPFSNGDHVWLYNIHGNLAANGFHVVDNATSNTFELAGTTGSGAYAGTGSTDTAVEVPVLVGSGLIELRRKPTGGAWASYRSSRVVFRFMPAHPDETVVLPFAIPQFEVTAEAGDEFELSIIVEAGEDITISSSGDFDPAGNIRITWEYAGA